MDDIDRVVEALRRRVDALEDENARLRQAAPHGRPSAASGSRRQVLLGGAGILGTLAGGALLGRAEPAYAASPDGVPPASAPAPRVLDKQLSLRTTLVPLKTRGVLWATYDWDFGGHFTADRPPVVVATAFDDYMEHDVAACCVCAVAVRGKAGAYHATLMVRGISLFATEVVVNAVALGG